MLLSPGSHEHRARQEGQAALTAAGGRVGGEVRSAVPTNRGVRAGTAGARMKPTCQTGKQAAFGFQALQAQGFRIKVPNQGLVMLLSVDFHQFSPPRSGPRHSECLGLVGPQDLSLKAGKAVSQCLGKTEVQTTVTPALLLWTSSWAPLTKAGVQHAQGWRPPTNPSLLHLPLPTVLALNSRRWPK